jgi:hypothetical protein
LPVSITNRIGASRHWSNTLTSDKEGFGERSSLRSNTLTSNKEGFGERSSLRSNPLTSNKEGFGERSSLRSNTLTSDKEGFGERSSLRAHKSEDTRTKRVAGILIYSFCLNILCFCHHYHHCQCI